MAISAVIAVGDLGDALVTAIANKARALRVGPPNAPDSDMGPLVTHRKNAVGYIDAGVREGVLLVVDGRTHAGRQRARAGDLSWTALVRPRLARDDDLS